MIILDVPGEPVGKARPRVTKWGAYTPEKTVNYETQIKERFAAKYPEHAPLECPVELNVVAYFAIPASTSKKKKEAMVALEIMPTKKPDLDNLLKIIGDALNNLAYQDDKQIVKCSILKYYSKQPRVEITIKEW